MSHLPSMVGDKGYEDGADLLQKIPRVVLVVMNPCYKFVLLGCNQRDFDAMVQLDNALIEDIVRNLLNGHGVLVATLGHHSVVFPDFLDNLYMVGSPIVDHHDSIYWRTPSLLNSFRVRCSQWYERTLIRLFAFLESV